MQRRLGVLDERLSPPSPPPNESKRPSTLRALRRRTSTLLSRSTSSSSSVSSKRSSIAVVDTRDIYAVGESLVATLPADDGALRPPSKVPPPTLPKSFTLPLSALVFDAMTTTADVEKSPMADSGHASRSPSLTTSSSITLPDGESGSEPRTIRVLREKFGAVPPPTCVVHLIG